MSDWCKAGAATTTAASVRAFFHKNEPFARRQYIEFCYGFLKAGHCGEALRALLDVRQDNEDLLERCIYNGTAQQMKFIVDLHIRGELRIPKYAWGSAFVDAASMGKEDMVRSIAETHCFSFSALCEALKQAVMMGKYDIVRFLVQYASSTVFDSNSFFLYIVFRNDLRMARFLLESGAVQASPCENARDVARARNRAELETMLAEHGFEYTGDSAKFAAQYDNLEWLKEIIESGRQQNDDDDGLLVEAVRHNSADVTAWLLGRVNHDEIGSALFSFCNGFKVTKLLHEALYDRPEVNMRDLFEALTPLDSWDQLHYVEVHWDNDDQYFFHRPWSHSGRCACNVRPRRFWLAHMLPLPTYFDAQILRAVGE